MYIENTINATIQFKKEYNSMNKLLNYLFGFILFSIYINAILRNSFWCAILKIEQDKQWVDKYYWYRIFIYPRIRDNTEHSIANNHFGLYRLCLRNVLGVEHQSGNFWHFHTKYLANLASTLSTIKCEYIRGASFKSEAFVF